MKKYLKDKTRQETKQQKGCDEEIKFNILMLFFAWNKSKETRSKKNKGNNNKKKTNKRNPKIRRVQGQVRWPKESTRPNNTIIIVFSANKLLKNNSRSRNSHFRTQKTQTQHSSYHVFALFFSLKNKKEKHLLKPYFYSVWANVKIR